MRSERSGPPVALPQRWSPLDLGLHAFLAVSPLGLGLWIFSLAPLVGGNLFLAVVLSGVVMLLGAVVLGSLAVGRPWTGGDYAWQTRLLDARVGAVLTLASWWLVATLLAPVFGNVMLVQVVDPILSEAGWDGLASWFRGRDGIFVCSLIAIAVATAFVGLGLRRAALVQRAVVAVGAVALFGVLVLLLTTGSPNEFRDAFDDRAAETYEASPLAASQIVDVGTLNASASDVEPGSSVALVPLVLLFALWIGWATPLAGEVRGAKGDMLRRVLVRAAAAWTVLSLVLLVAIGRGVTWELWSEANNLYWGTVYDTTAPSPLPAWPSPLVFATWLPDSTLLGYALLIGMSAWVIGWTATLFLPATRVLVAAAADGVLPQRLARTSGDSVPTAALAVLVVPACGLAALDAYWSSFGGWAAVGVVALGLTTLGSALSAFVAFRRGQRLVAALSVLFAAIVAVTIGAWLLDPVYGLRGIGPLLFLLLLYAVAVVVTGVRRPGSPARSPTPRGARRTSRPA